MMSNNPDAHSASELDLTHWGLEMARRGGVPADRVLNALTLSQLMQHLKRRKGNTGLCRAKNDGKEQAMPAMAFSRKLQRPARGRIRSTAIAGR